MAFRYLIYSTGTTYSGTILRESATNNPSVGEASLYSEFVIPEIQPLYLWQVSLGNVIPNTDTKITNYEGATAPAPTPQDLITYGEVTGMTNTKIDKVSGASNKVPVFNAGGNLQSSGFSVAEITGKTTYNFTGSGGTQIFKTGNNITVYSTMPSGATIAWIDVSDKPSWLSGTTLGAFESAHSHSQYLTAASITGKLDTSVFNGYTGSTQPILNKALTGVTNNGTGTTLGGFSARKVTLKSISAIGGVKILAGDANNLIISGETNASAVWGGITGTLSNQTDLWGQLTGLTAQVNTKLNTSTFATYTGTTAPNAFASKSFVSNYTGVTAPNTYATIAKVNLYTGTTAPATFANKALVQYYTGTTAPATYQTIAKVDFYTGTTAPNTFANKALVNFYTGTTAPNTYLTKSTFNNYTGTSTSILSGAITGATNGLSKSGRNAQLGGALTKDTSINGTAFGFTANTKNITLQAINGINIIDTDGVGGINIESDGGTIAIIGNNSVGAEKTKLEVSDTNLLITDSRATQLGLQYAADYATTFATRSLVDKGYVDAIASGLVPKASVKVATTGVIVLSGLSTVDGVTLTNGDRVLVKNQGTGSQNGIYVASASTWSRAADFDGQPVFGEVTSGNLVPIESGTTLHNTIWVLTTLNPIVVGTTSLAFSLFSSSQSLQAGVGITINANQISVNGSTLAGNSITWTGNTFNVNPSSGTLATALGTKLNITDFNTYSGTTVPATFLSISNFNTFTGTTLPANYYNKTQINSYSGSTLTNINSRLLTTTFNSYTGATNTRLNGIESDITYISGVTDNNFEIFTGYTASTATNQIQLIHTGGTDINTVVATGIEWHSVSHSGNSFTWTGGTDIVINKTADYEVSYHVPHGHTGTNNIRGIASNLVLNGVTILNNTVGTSGTARAGVVSSLVLPNTILSLNANDILDLVAFRTGLAGVSTTVANGVILIKEKNKLQ